MKKNTRILVLANLIGLTAVLVVNFLANSLPLHGKTTGELSGQYPNLFTPAGSTFAIWGVLYLWFIVWAGFQVAALMSHKIGIRMEPMLEKIGWLFAYACLLNIGWLFAWHWEQLLVSVVVMANLLYILIQLNLAANVGWSSSGKLEKWLQQLPFGIYQGWITVALIANVTAWLVSLGWSGGGLPAWGWATIMAITGGSIAIFMVFWQRNWGHGLAVAWALYGIYLERNQAADEGSNHVALVAITLSAAILLLLVVRYRK
jgi:hypothetical protein